MSVNTAKVDIRAFSYEILHNLNMYQSPMDFWVMPTGTASREIKRLDKRSIKPLENSINIKERLDSNDCITFRDIIGVSLHLDAYRKSQQYSAYFKWLDTYHNVQDEKCESIFLHTYTNVTQYLLAIRRLWNNVLYIPHIEEYLKKIQNFFLKVQSTLTVRISVILHSRFIQRYYHYFAVRKPCLQMMLTKYQKGYCHHAITPMYICLLLDIFTKDGLMNQNLFRPRKPTMENSRKSTNWILVYYSRGALQNSIYPTKIK